MGLLPTPVGMFRVHSRGGVGVGSSPHARGDVPSSALPAPSAASFSPRPWGCSALGKFPAQAAELLPTPVGMFRFARLAHLRPCASPHARGDVPRTRREGWHQCSLLPTPVGMFRFDAVERVERGASPHARGDVPRLSGAHSTGPRFSPRPWGCSECQTLPETTYQLLPTPVGMFRS